MTSSGEGSALAGVAPASETGARAIQQLSVSAPTSGALGQYIFYVTIAGMKIGLFYYIARVFPQSDFARFHIYLYYTDIMLTAVSAGTITYLAMQSDVPLAKRLGVAFRCENAAAVILLSLLIGATSMGAFQPEAGISIALVGIVALGRANTNLFSRYYLFGGRLTRSLMNDLFGNWLWTVVLVLLLSWNISVSLEGILALWIASLFATTTWNAVALRTVLRDRVQWADIRRFIRPAAGSFMFVAVGSSYFGLEKLVFLRKFDSIGLFSSYVFLTRVVGAVAEVSVNFLGLFTSSRLRRMNDARAWYFDWIIILTASAFAIILVLLLVMGDALQAHFPDKLASEHLWLAGFVVVQAFLFHALSVGTLYFQRFRRLLYRNATALFMISGLALLSLAAFGVSTYLSVQVSLLGAVLLMDVTARRLAT